MDTQAPFDRRAVRAHRDRAAAKYADHDFLVRKAAEGMAERLDYIARAFPRVLELGSGIGATAEILGAHGGFRDWTHADLSADMAFRLRGAGDRRAVVADEEALPFGAEAFDAITSVLALHWVNDLPGALVQARRCLRPDGLFLATLLGGETLAGLRAAFLAAEAELEGGAGLRVSPFLDVRDAGDLLQRAGFALAVADTDTLSVSYPNPLALMADLRGMGEANSLTARRRTFTRRATLMRAAEIYAEREDDGQGHVSATFQVITMTAWAPAESQPKPLAPGSAQVSLAGALGTTERPAGEVAGPSKKRR